MDDALRAGQRTILLIVLSTVKVWQARAQQTTPGQQRCGFRASASYSLQAVGRRRCLWCGATVAVGKMSVCTLASGRLMQHATVQLMGCLLGAPQVRRHSYLSGSSQLHESRPPHSCGTACDAGVANRCGVGGRESKQTFMLCMAAGRWDTSGDREACGHGPGAQKCCGPRGWRPRAGWA